MNNTNLTNSTPSPAAAKTPANTQPITPNKTTATSPPVKNTVSPKPALKTAPTTSNQTPPAQPQPTKPQPTKPSTKVEPNPSPSNNTGFKSIEQKQKIVKKPKWWQFWAKTTPQDNTTNLNTSNTAEPIKTNNLQPDITTEPILPVRRDKLSVLDSNNQDPETLDRMNSANVLVKAEKKSQEQLMQVFNELKANSSELNLTLKDISQHLKASTARDEKVIAAIESVDKSVAKADKTFTECSTAFEQSSKSIIASAEKSDQSIAKLSEHVNNSSTTFKEVAKQIETNDTENREALLQLQKRSNTLILSLGITIAIIAIVALILYVMNL